jgi:hypothetical protein
MGQMVKAVKQDAKVNIEMTVGHLHRFQQLLLFVSNGKTEKELQHFKTIIENEEKDKIEHWMELVVFLTYFIKIIEDKAEETGQLTEIDLDAYVEKIKNFTEQNTTPKKD